MSYDTIRKAHKASGATVTELANATGISRSRLGEWLSRAKPDAKPRRTIYAAPDADDVSAVVGAALAVAQSNVKELERLAAVELPSRACADLELRG